MKKYSRITYTASFRDYLNKYYSESKICRLLYKAYYYYDTYPYNKITTDKEINYITFRNDGSISYLPNGKEHKTSNNEWLRDGRQTGKAAKVIRKLFSSHVLKCLKDSDFEFFSNTYKSYYGGDNYKFELLPCSKISSVYDMRRSNEGSGSLHDSCMNNDTDYLEIYDRCKSLQILVLKDKENNLAGRSLVWKIDNDITLLDRIYVTHDWQYELFISYANDKGYWHKENYNSYKDKRDFITHEGKCVTRTFKIETDTDCDYYPYIDTFSYGDDGILSNSSCEMPYSYDNTDGTRSGEKNEHEGETYDSLNDEWISEDDARYIERGQHRGTVTHYDNTVEVNGLIYWVNDDSIVYSEYDDRHYKDDECVYSEKEGTYILCEDSVEIDDEYYHINDDDIIEINDTWYLKTSDEIIEIDDEYYEKDSDEVCCIDGEYYLTDDENIVLIGDEYFLKDDDNVIKIEGNYFLRQLRFPYSLIA